VRAFAETALQTLHNSGASSTAPPPARRDIDGERAEAISALHTLLPQGLVSISPLKPNGPPVSNHPLLETSLEFQSSLVADLVHSRQFDDKDAWNRCVGVYLKPWLGEAEGSTFAEAVRSHFQAIDRVGFRVSFYLQLTSWLIG
jgi:elongation factor 3